MIEFLHMGWPMAVVLVAAIIGFTVMYGMRSTFRNEQNARAHTVLNGTVKLPSANRDMDD